LSDFARLEEKLNKLKGRDRTPGEARKLRGATGNELLASLVAEIDETILPRRLTLSVENGPVIHLAVANRKLQALVAPAPAIDGAGEIEGQAIPDAEDAAVQSLRGVLNNAFDGAVGVSVSAVRLKTMFGSDIGVPSNMLARAWDLAAPKKGDQSPSEILDGFLASHGKDATAWLRIDGEEVSGQDGDEAIVASMGEKAAVFLDSYFSRFDVIFPTDALSCATLVAPKGEDRLSLLFIEYSDVSAFLAATPSKAINLATSWQKLVAD